MSGHKHDHEDQSEPVVSSQDKTIEDESWLPREDDVIFDQNHG